jgi:hypothetical protein
MAAGNISPKSKKSPALELRPPVFGTAFLMHARSKALHGVPRGSHCPSSTRDPRPLFCSQMGKKSQRLDRQSAGVTSCITGKGNAQIALNDQSSWARCSCTCVCSCSVFPLKISISLNHCKQSSGQVDSGCSLGRRPNPCPPFSKK